MSNEVFKDTHVNVSDLSKIINFIGRVDGIKDSLPQAKNSKKLGAEAALKLTLNDQTDLISGAHGASQLIGFLSVLLDLDKDPSKPLSQKLDLNSLSKEERDQRCQMYKKTMVDFVSGFIDKMAEQMDDNVSFLRVLSRLMDSDSLPSQHSMMTEDSNVGYILFYKDKQGRPKTERIMRRGKYGSVMAEIKNSGVFITSDSSTPRALIDEREFIEGVHENIGKYMVCTREFYEEHGAPEL